MRAWIREEEEVIEVDRFKSRRNQFASGPFKVMAQNLTFFYFSSSRKSSLRPRKRKR